MVGKCSAPNKPTIRAGRPVFGGGMLTYIGLVRLSDSGLGDTQKLALSLRVAVTTAIRHPSSMPARASHIAANGSAPAMIWLPSPAHHGMI